jgi:hypothetical protein
LGRLDQPGGGLHRVGEGLLHQHRHAGLDARQATLDVQPVRRGEDDAVGAVPLEELGQGPVPRDPVLVGQRVRGRRRADDRSEPDGGAGGDLRGVPTSDGAGADHGDPHGRFPGHGAS